MTETQVHVQIVIPEGDVGSAQELARQVGLDAQILGKSQVVDPFTWILIGGVALATAVFIRDLVERSQGGLVIDLAAAGSARIDRNRQVPQGWVLIFSPDGKEVSIQIRDAPKDTIERLLSEIVSGGYKTATEIAKEARKVLPGGKVTE